MGKVINIILVEFATHENKCCTYVNKLKKRRKYVWIQMNLTPFLFGQSAVKLNKYPEIL